MEIKIILSDAEAKAMSYIANSPQEWAENAIHERARLAIDEIFQMEVQRMLADPDTKEIPADRESVVMAADLKMANERQSEVMQDGTRLPS